MDAQIITDSQIADPSDPIRFPASDYGYVSENTITATGFGQYPVLNIDTLGAQMSESQCILPALSFLWIQHVVVADQSATRKFTPLAVAPKNGFPHIDYCSVCTKERALQIVDSNHIPHH